MSLNDKALYLAKYGEFFYTDPNSKLNNIENFYDFLNKDTIDDEGTVWTNLGHTSLENLPAFNNEDAEQTTFSTFAKRNIFTSITTDPIVKLEGSAVQWDNETVKLLTGGEVDEDDNGILTPLSNDGVNKAFMFCTLGSTNAGTALMAWYFPTATIQTNGSLTLGTDALTEQPFVLTIGSPETGVLNALSSGIQPVYKYYFIDANTLASEDGGAVSSISNGVKTTSSSSSETSTKKSTT